MLNIVNHKHLQEVLAAQTPEAFVSLIDKLQYLAKYFDKGDGWVTVTPDGPNAFGLTFTSVKVSAEPGRRNPTAWLDDWMYGGLVRHGDEWGIHT